MITCPNCGSNKVIKAGTREDRLGQVGQRYLCHSCGRKFTQKENKKFDSEFRFQDNKFVITSAQNNTVINKDFFKSLLMYCTANEARLIILPSRYLLDSEEANWDPVLLPYMVQGNFNISKKLRVLGGINLLPTIENPLMGLDYLSKGDSLIVGHPQLQMKSLAVNSTDSAAILTTTGTITKPNYSNTKQGLKAEFNHSYSAVVIEREKDIFHYRTLNADDSGGFYDIDGYYTHNAFYPEAQVDALILGDTHAVFIDPDVKKATFTNPDSIVNVLKPKQILHHDLADIFATSHHHSKDFFTRYGKYLTGLNSIEDELNDVVELLRETTPPNTKLVIVSSNHNNHLKQWLNSADPKLDPVNAKIYHYLMYLMLEGVKTSNKSFSFENPLELWVSQNTPDLDIQWLNNGQSYKIHDIECGQHGDQGQNGTRGSNLGFSKLAQKYITGHSHSPSIIRGAWQNGTSSLLKMGYNIGGASSWLHSHTVIYPNGRRQMIFIVDGKWRG
jgi:DNA-directed RNA polymerase subunit RPC12/RpoP